MEAIDQADLVITVGYDVAELAPRKWNPDGTKRIVHIDFDPAEVYGHYVPDVEVVGDISGALWEINQRLDKEHEHFDTEWFGEARQHIWDDIGSWDLEEGQAFTVPGVLNVIREVLMADEDRIVITHGTDGMVETALYLAGRGLEKSVVITGAIIPFAFGISDSPFNLGSALAFVQVVPPGVYVVMNGRLFEANNVRKEVETGTFQLVMSDHDTPFDVTGKDGPGVIL